MMTYYMSPFREYLYLLGLISYYILFIHIYDTAYHATTPEMIRQQIPHYRFCSIFYTFCFLPAAYLLMPICDDIIYIDIYF